MPPSDHHPCMQTDIICHLLQANKRYKFPVKLWDVSATVFIVNLLLHEKWKEMSVSNIAHQFQHCVCIQMLAKVLYKHRPRQFKSCTNTH